MLSFDRLCNEKKNFSRLTGVRLNEFHEIIRKVSPKWEEIQRKKKVSGRSSKLKTLEDEVLLVLIYYRFYVSFQFLEMLFDLDESNICRHIQKIEPILASAVKINKNRELTQSALETILIDATEIPIQRPSKNQRKYYCAARCTCTRRFGISRDAKTPYENSFTAQTKTKNSSHSRAKSSQYISFFQTNSRRARIRSAQKIQNFGLDIQKFQKKTPPEIQYRRRYLQFALRLVLFLYAAPPPSIILSYFRKRSIFTLYFYYIILLKIFILF